MVGAVERADDGGMKRWIWIRMDSVVVCRRQARKQSQLRDDYGTAGGKDNLGIYCPRGHRACRLRGAPRRLRIRGEICRRAASRWSLVVGLFNLAQLNC